MHIVCPVAGWCSAYGHEIQEVAFASGWYVSTGHGTQADAVECGLYDPGKHARSVAVVVVVDVDVDVDVGLAVRDTMYESPVRHAGGNVYVVSMVRLNCMVSVG